MFDGNDDKVEVVSLFSAAHGKRREPASLEAEEIVPLDVQEARIESIHGTCSRASNGRTMVYGVHNCL